MFSLPALFLWLAYFLHGTAQTASGTGRRVCLFGIACGRDRLATLSFRLAFVTAVAEPLLWLTLPSLHKADPLWAEDRMLLLARTGAALACLGTALALFAQWARGASRFVDIQAEETCALISGGLFPFLRNPTFLGQAVLLAEVALAVPSLTTAIAPSCSSGRPKSVSAARTPPRWPRMVKSMPTAWRVRRAELGLQKGWP